MRAEQIYIYDFSNLDSEDDDFKLLKYGTFKKYEAKPFLVELIFHPDFDIEDFMSQFSHEIIYETKNVMAKYCSNFYAMDRESFAALRLMVKLLVEDYD